MELIHVFLKLCHFLCDLIQVSFFWVFRELFEVALVVVQKVCEVIFFSQGFKEVCEQPVDLLDTLGAI